MFTREAPEPPVFRSRKLIFRELDRLFETVPNTTRESTRTRNRRACIPSRVTRLEADQALEFQAIYMSALEETVRKHRGRTQFQSGAAAPRPSCTLLGGSSPFQSRRAHVFSFLLQIVGGEPGPCDGRNAAAV